MDFFNLRIGWGSIVLLSLILTEFGLGTGCGAPTTPSSLSSDWVAQVNGEKRISELSIPGTHDAGALYEPWAGTTRCQSRTIPEQLADGVRFLDIRCRDVRGKFQIYHGRVDQKLSFDAVLTNCFAFLQAHPKEFIIMSVKEEGAPVDDARPFEELFDGYVAKNRDGWILADAFPKVAEVRGHVVLFRRFSAASLPKGIAADPRDWKDSTNFWIQGTVRVQDEYVVSKGKELSKWLAIQSLFRESSSTNSNVLFVNFSSGYEPRLLPDIPAVSDFINPRLKDYFQGAPARRYGITVMDFETAERCALIFHTNFQMESVGGRREP